MKKILGVAAGLFGAAVIAAATPGWAHHAVNAQFDSGKEASLTGVLLEFKNSAPHAYWVLMDPKKSNDPKANAKWEFESVAPANLRRAGIKLKDDIVVGDTYTIFFSPSRDGSQTGLMRSIAIKGKRFEFTPGYIVPKS